MVRDAYLVHLLLDRFKVDKVTMDQEDNALMATSIIIFTLKCKTCERVRLMLKELGIRSTALHSKMNQNERLGSIAKFKAGVVPILVTTDVGSR
jgi:ATP-dependent RNA helicase DDX49/DBP8